MDIFSDLEKITSISAGVLFIIFVTIILVKVINVLLYWEICDRMKRFENSQKYLFEQLETISANLYLISLKMEEDSDKTQKDLNDYSNG